MIYTLSVVKKGDAMKSLKRFLVEWRARRADRERWAVADFNSRLWELAPAVARARSVSFEEFLSERKKGGWR